MDKVEVNNDISKNLCGIARLANMLNSCAAELAIAKEDLDVASKK